MVDGIVNLATRDDALRGASFTPFPDFEGILLDDRSFFEPKVVGLMSALLLDSSPESSDSEVDKGGASNSGSGLELDVRSGSDSESERPFRFPEFAGFDFMLGSTGKPPTCLRSGFGCAL